MATKHQFIAGHYLAYYGNLGSEGLDGLSIGTTINGFKMVESTHEEEIRVDEGGDTVVDTLWRGKDVFVELDYAEYVKIRDALYVQQGQDEDVYSRVAHRGSTTALPLLLIPVVASENTESYIFFAAQVHGNIETLLATSLRMGPVSFRCLPYQEDTEFTDADGNAHGNVQGKHYEVF